MRASWHFFSLRLFSIWIKLSTFVNIYPSTILQADRNKILWTHSHYVSVCTTMTNPNRQRQTYTLWGHFEYKCLFCSNRMVLTDNFECLIRLKMPRHGMARLLPFLRPSSWTIYFFSFLVSWSFVSHTKSFHSSSFILSLYLFLLYHIPKRKKKHQTRWHSFTYILCGSLLRWNE